MWCADLDHRPQRGFETVTVYGGRGIHQPCQRLAKQWRNRERREPGARAVRADDAYRLRQRRRRERPDDETRREKSRQRDLTFAAKRGSSGERGERAEAEAR